MRSGAIRNGLAILAATAGLAFAGCGGDDSDSASVGDCVDESNAVVECDSPEAAKTLVSDQSEPDAIACVTIGDKPQVEVKVGDKTFCAEEL
jgi:hypothetical protein